MNKLPLIIVIALLITTINMPIRTEAQVREVWRWNDPGVWQYDHHVIDDSGNVIMAQFQVISAGVFNTKVIKLSSNGSVSWNTIWDYDKTGRIFALNSDSHGSVYTVGVMGYSLGSDTVVYCKHNLDGTLSWSKKKASADSTGYMSGTVTSNGTMFAGLVKQNVVGPPGYNCIKKNEQGLCDWYDSSGSILSEYISPSTGIDISDNHLWGRYADEAGFVYLENWVEDDICFIWDYCERDYNCSVLDSLYLIKLTSAGTVIYRKAGLMEHTTYAVTSSGDIYMTKAGEILEKYDQQGALLWTGSLPANTWWHELMVDPSEQSVKVFSYLDDYSGYYISSFASDSTAQWQIAGPNANFSGTKKCLDYEGNLYLSNAPNKAIDRINNVTGHFDWTYAADTSGILEMKAMQDGDLIVMRRGYVQRLTQARSVTLLDANRDTLPNTEMYLIRVNSNAPVYTEDTLGTVSTDADGEVLLWPR